MNNAFSPTTLHFLVNPAIGRLQLCPAAHILFDSFSNAAEHSAHGYFCWRPEKGQNFCAKSRIFSKPHFLINITQKTKKKFRRLACLSDTNEQTTTFPLKVVSSIIISSFFGGRIISRLATSKERPLRGGRGEGEGRGENGGRVVSEGEGDWGGGY
jgi:hypothetical protein